MQTMVKRTVLKSDGKIEFYQEDVLVATIIGDPHCHGCFISMCNYWEILGQLPVETNEIVIQE